MDKKNNPLISGVIAELNELSKYGKFESISVEYKFQGQEQSGGFQVFEKLNDES